MGKRLISFVLTLTLLLTLCPVGILAADSPEITITGQANNITVREPEPTPAEDGQVVSGKLELTKLEQSIQRDYAQTCMIRVRNTSDEAQEFYLDIVNNYNDLSMEIIKSGAPKSPAILAAGESMDVELTVFAQNAEHEAYVIPVTAYVRSGDDFQEDSKDNVRLNCQLPDLNLTWTMVSSSASTLRQTWKVTNNGEDLADLTIGADEKLSGYLSFAPIVSNYELRSGASVQIEVRPDLAKMKNESVSVLQGMLVASCAGKNSNQAVSFDTQGQEITVTTMGQLALRQDKNPFSKVEVIDESVKFFYFDGEKSVPIDENTDFASTIEEDGSFNIQTAFQLDVGANVPVKIDTTYSVYPLDKPAEKGVIGSEINDLEDGSIQTKLTVAISAEEYYQLLSAARGDSTKNSSAKAKALSDDYIDLSTGDKAEYAIDAFTTYDDALEAGKWIWNRDFAEIYGEFGNGGEIPGASIIEGLHTAYSFCKDTKEYYDGMHDPRLSDEVKNAYSQIYWYNNLCTIGSLYASAALGAICPPAGFLMGAIAYFGSQMAKGLKEELLASAYAEYYAQLQGHQCTNRGRVTASFYTPDYSRNGDSRPKMYSTSRLHGGGYVDRTDTNYDVTLNGDDAGRVKDSGLTDVTIAEIPTDSLKPGENNTIDFDYDTNPGSHFVTSDTEITLLYPADTEIAYIGEPDDLQDVRPKPDFCVYDENLYTSDDLIQGEQGKLYFNVYNRGSRGGWFDIVFYENDREIYRESNYYLEAFSSKTLSIDYTPTEEHATVKVVLTNTSINLDERSEENNTASRTIDARKRQVPGVQSLNSGKIFEKQPFSLVIDLENTKDLTSADFLLDGKTQPSEVRSSEQSGGVRYWVSFSEGIDIGEHTLTTQLTYQTGPEQTSVKQESHSFEVLEEIWAVPDAELTSDTYLYGNAYDFYVNNPEHLTSVEISIGGEAFRKVDPVSEGARSNRYSVDLSGCKAGETAVNVRMNYVDKAGKAQTLNRETQITIVSEADSFFTFTLAANPENPDISVYRWNSEVSCSFEEVEPGVYRCPKTMDMYRSPEVYTVVVSYPNVLLVTDMSKNDQTLTESGCRKLTIQKSESTSIGYAELYSLRLASGYMIYLSDSFAPEKPLLVTPGIYTISLSGQIDNVYFSRSPEVDLTELDQTFDLTSFVLRYEFKLKYPTDEYFNATMYLRDNESDTYWYTRSFNCSYSNGEELSCYSSSSWTVDDVRNSYEAVLMIWSDSELYFVQVRENGREVLTGTGTLDRDALHQVTLKPKQDDWSIRSVYVSRDDFSCSLYNNPIYLPGGDYTFSVEMSANGKSLTSGAAATVSGDCEVPVGMDLSTFRDLTISWAEPFDREGYVRYTMDDGSRITDSNFTSGSTIRAMDGSGSFYINLDYGDDSFELNRRFDVSEENLQLRAGNHFSGSVSGFYGSYAAGDTVGIRIYDATDEYGNQLSSFYAYDKPLTGIATFVDVNDPTRVFTTSTTCTSYYNMQVLLPEAGGTFTLTVEYTTAVLRTVTFESNGGSFVDSATVSDGNAVAKPADPVKENYLFQGWFEDEALTVPHDFNAPVTDDLTLYAKWDGLENNIYTVTFDANGGSKVPAISVVEGNAAVKPADPVWEGHSFLGWFRGEEAYDFTAPVGESFTLTAKWEAAVYTVTFDSRGGSEVAGVQVPYGEKLPMPADPVRDADTFVGWYEDAALTIPYDFAAAVTADLRLFAKWESPEPETFTVTFDSQGGSDVEPQQVQEGAQAQRPEEPKRAGYTFDGWFKGKNDVQPYDFDAPVNGDLTLLARWSQIPEPSSTAAPMPTATPRPVTPPTPTVTPKPAETPVPTATPAPADEILVTSSGTAATISATTKALQKADRDLRNAPLTIDASKAGSEIDTVVIPTELAEQIRAMKNANGLKVRLSHSEFTLDDQALAEAIADAKGEGNLILTIREMDLKDLSKDQSKALAKKDLARGYTVTLKADGHPVTALDEGRMEIAVDYQVEKGTKGVDHRLYQVSDGGVKDARATFASAAVRGRLQEISDVFVVSEKAVNPFQDVKAGQYWYDPILWAVNTGVTTGISDSVFAPNGDCSRAQMVTFLWRTAGAPKPAGTNTKFTDIPADASADWYRDAVQWAVEQNITTGVTDTTFAPDETVTRAQTVTFFKRMVALNESPESENSKFTDIPDDTSSDWYRDAVQWGVENGIIQGVTDTTFAPMDNCTRGQIVTILYRYFTR